jgi:anhydro-N-acetylmuramic acid kinase
MNFAKKNNPEFPELLAIGLMSGTSLDGIDVALVKSNGHNCTPWGKPFHLPYSDKDKTRLQEALEIARVERKPNKSNKTINELENFLTNLHYNAVVATLNLNGLKNSDIDVVGFHGQTLLHKPEERWSWQIGCGRTLSKKLKITVVNDFRRYDVSNGGQGAPLVPIYHHALFDTKRNEYPVAILNIGGVANLTWNDGRSTERLVAFDTGPGNALLDDWITKNSALPFDKKGMISSKGKVKRSLVKKWMENPYFLMLPPKSLDRNQFDVSGLQKSSNVENYFEDGAATLCAFTVEAIKLAESQCPAPVKQWYVCGGGAHNPTLMNMLSKKLSGKVNLASDIGWSGDFIEAQAFAFLAVRTLYDLPITFPRTTGINKPSTGGVIHKG